MNKIIVISGKQYSGKDTLAKILLKKLDGYQRIGLGDAIKIQYGKINNLTFQEIEANKHIYRDDLIKLGNWGRAKDEDYWLKNLSGMNKIIVPDVRFLHEVEYFRCQGAFVVRVDSCLEERSKRGIITNIDDNTEIELDSYSSWDFVVNNNFDIEYLYSKADELVQLFNNYTKAY